MLTVAGVVRFLSSPMGKVLGASLAIMLWTLYQRQDAASDVRAEYAQELAAAKLKAAQEAERLASEARVRADQAEAELEILRENYSEILESLPDDSCVLPADIIERLRRIQ